VCVTPWNAAPHDRHCCPAADACPGSQQGCCENVSGGPTLTCVARTNPPPGTPTHACVTG
jgi:hypothetical protein